MLLRKNKTIYTVRTQLFNYYDAEFHYIPGFALFPICIAKYTLDMTVRVTYPFAVQFLTYCIGL